MSMSEFEQLAVDMAGVIGTARRRIPEYGYSNVPIEETVSALNGAFISWLVACEEARVTERLGVKKASYRSHIIEELPELDDPNWPTYVPYGTVATLKNRAKGLWGCRVAYTHSIGRIDHIAVASNRRFAELVPDYLDGARVQGNRLDLSQLNMHLVVRTAEQIRALFAVEI